MQQIALRSDDADLAIRHLDALSKRSEMVAAIAAASDPYPLASGCSKFPHHGGRDGLMAVAFERGGRSLRLGLRLIADRFEAGDPVLERRVVQIGHAALDGVVKALEPQIGLGGPPVQLGDVLAAALGAFLAAIEDGCQHLLKPFGLKQSALDMAGNQVVQLLHRD